MTNLSLSDVASEQGSAPIPLKELMEYKPPGPPPKTGKHRYVLLAFSPLNGTSEPLNFIKPTDRRRWGYEKAGEGVGRWAEEMGLVPIGEWSLLVRYSIHELADSIKIAADFFKAKYHK